MLIEPQKSESILQTLDIDLSSLKASGIPRLKMAQYRAIVNWLTKYQPPSSSSNLEKVRAYIESCYHLFQLEDWEKADRILLIRVPGLMEALDDALGTWGASSTQIDLYKNLINKLNPIRNIELLNGLTTRLEIFRQP
jgi:hypothetical protein